MEHMDIFNTKPYTGTNEPTTKKTKKEKTNEQKPSKAYFNINDNPELKERWYKVFYSIFRCIGIKKPNLDKETFAKVARDLNRWLYTSLKEDIGSYKDSPVWCCNNLAITLYMIAQINLETYPAIKYHSTINRCEELVTNPASVELFLSVANEYKAAVNEFKEKQNHSL